MSTSFGDDTISDPATMRGREWPCLRQFCVFLENRVGRLHDLLRHIEKDDLRIVGLSIVDSVECAIVRLMVNNVDRGRELFRFSNFTVFESDIVGVELPEGPQPFLTICSVLLQAELNIHYTYPLLFRQQGRGAIALYVDDLDQALQLLKDSGLRIITENDLLEDDEYF
ncbi:MAG TPA: acetolactate synthase [Planctomycetaceae bacterium]|nr:acetolactate synthase [Planctomycetaceae bacterium]